MSYSYHDLKWSFIVPR